MVVVVGTKQTALDRTYLVIWIWHGAPPVPRYKLVYHREVRSLVASPILVGNGARQCGKKSILATHSIIFGGLLLKFILGIAHRNARFFHRHCLSQKTNILFTGRMLFRGSRNRYISDVVDEKCATTCPTRRFFMAESGTGLIHRIPLSME